MPLLSKKLKRWLLPIVCMAVLTPFTPYLDLKLAKFFFNGGIPPQFSNNSFLQFVYDYGVMPANFMAGVFFIIYLISFKKAELEAWRPIALSFLLTLLIGGGLIVHLVLKEHWGRPRPRQVIEFGGTQPFLPFYKPQLNSKKFNDNYKSFSCGHCTMGFVFFSLFVTGKRLGRRKLQIVGLALALILGSLLSFARIAQGGHFFSDVLISALILWISALIVDKFT